jgi:1-phosphofructokinase
VGSSAQVMVFAPAPQLTVTIERLGARTELHLHAGGQGLWQARMLTALDVPVTFCAVLGGEVGRVLEPLITSEVTSLRAVHRSQDNGWYVHDRRDGDREVLAEEYGEPVDRHELDDLYTIALAEGLRAGTALLSGPARPGLVPPDAYRRLSLDLTRNGCRVAADLTGEHLEAVLEGDPEFVKVSHEDVDDPRAALRQLREAGAGTVVISRAEKPALALVDDDVLEVRMPQLSTAEHRGAGDAMTAATVAMIAQGHDIRSALRAGAAAGALNVTRHGLGSGRLEAIAELAKHVELRQVDDE